MKEIKITINSNGDTYYNNYWIDFNNIECYKSDMDGNKRFNSKIEMFNWIDERELVLYYNQCESKNINENNFIAKRWENISEILNDN